MAESRFVEMAEGGYFKCLGNNESLLSSDSDTRRNSTCSEFSLSSSGSEASTRSKFMLSSSGSELSIRTGSVAYNRLPPRPAPPPPHLPLEKMRCRKASGSEETSDAKSSLNLKSRKPCSKKKSFGSKSLPLIRQNSRKDSSPGFHSQSNNCSIPDKIVPRTFSSNGLQRVIYSLPPSYPPPPPPINIPPTHPPPQSSCPQLSYPPPTSPVSLRQMYPESSLSSSQKCTCLKSTPLDFPPPSYPPPPPPSPSPFPKIPPRPPKHLLALTRMSQPPQQGPETQEMPVLNQNSYISSEHTFYQTIESHRNVVSPNLNRKLIFLTAMSLIFSVACCCFAVFCFMYYKQALTPLKVCVNLEKDFGTISGDVFQNLTVGKSGEYCADTGDELSNLLQAMIRMKANINATGLNPSKVRQLIHASALQYFQESDVPSTDCKSSVYAKRRLNLRTSDNGDFKQHSENVDVKSDGLGILYPGWYYIYSSINFIPQQCLTKIHTENFIIRRKQDNSTTVLIMNKNSCHIDCSSNFITSFSGGVFQLVKNDVIFVNVSTWSDMINIDNPNSYLGLVMVSTTQP